jgi:hypothetical protein
MSKSDSDNDLSLFREAGGRAKVGGGEGERERTERGDEDMVLLVVIVWNGLEDCGAEMFEMSLFEHMKMRKERREEVFSKERRRGRDILIHRLIQYSNVRMGQ